MKHCIYLNDTEPPLTFASEEHIFPAGIGGIRKLPMDYVSHDANNAFSALELNFMRKSFLSVPRQFVGPGKRGSLSHTKATKSQIIITHSDNPELIGFGYVSLGDLYHIPEVKFNTDGSIQFRDTKSTEEPLVEFNKFAARLKNFNNKYSLHEHENFDKDTFVLGLHDGKWHLGLSNKNLIPQVDTLINGLLQTLESGETTSRSSEISSLETNTQQFLEIAEDDFRVCAKIAFNYLAFLKGQNFVLNECFDPLRNWIVHGGKNRFVQLTANTESFNFTVPFPKDSHWIVVFQKKNYLVAYISFYGEAFNTVITLTDNFTDQPPFHHDGFICDWLNKKEYTLIEYIDKHGHE